MANWLELNDGDIPPDYASCDGVSEDPIDLFFHCPRMTEVRRNLERTLGEILSQKDAACQKD